MLPLSPVIAAGITVDGERDPVGDSEYVFQFTHANGGLITDYFDVEDVYTYLSGSDNVHYWAFHEYDNTREPGDYDDDTGTNATLVFDTVPGGTYHRAWNGVDYAIEWTPLDNNIGSLVLNQWNGSSWTQVSGATIAAKVGDPASQANSGSLGEYIWEWSLDLDDIGYTGSANDLRWGLYIDTPTINDEIVPGNDLFTPEPGSLAVLALGLMGGLFWRRKKA